MINDMTKKNKVENKFLEAIGKLKNIHANQGKRREIAYIKTLLREKELSS